MAGSDRLNYYKDTFGHLDVESCPHKRPDELCLNCNLPWAKHSGWKCGNDGVAHEFDDTSLHDRYLTPSMALSRTNRRLTGKYAYLYDPETGKPLNLPDVRPQGESVAVQSFTGPDLSDWKTWAKVPKGYCPCNVPAHQCPDPDHKRKYAHL